MMGLNSNSNSFVSMAELLRQAADRTGLSPSDMEDLLDSELTVAQLIGYIDAVVSERMN